MTFLTLNRFFNLKILFIVVCFCMHLSFFCMCMYVCICVLARQVFYHWAKPPTPSPYILRQHLSLNLELLDLARLAGQQTPRIFLFLPSKCRCVLPGLTRHWSQTWVFMIAWQALPWVLFPSPLGFYFVLFCFKVEGWPWPSNPPLFSSVGIRGLHFYVQFILTFITLLGFSWQILVIIA